MILYNQKNSFSLNGILYLLVKEFMKPLSDNIKIDSLIEVILVKNTKAIGMKISTNVDTAIGLKN